MKSKPVCFIAMAFNRDDTDSLYDNLILPVLQRNNVKPVIINRRQSNQDLNIQIIKQLEGCDFCIVDLTYARPSVYYEAGFAERSVPVIYTVRKDHLRSGQTDDLRVHFDLQMKPLITWKDVDDKSLSKRLETRLKATVLKDWSNRVKEDTKIRIAIERFESLSQVDRLAILRRRPMNRLKQLGYKTWRAPEHPHRVYSYKQIWSGHVNDVFSMMAGSNSYHFVSVHSYPSATKKSSY